MPATARVATTAPPRPAVSRKLQSGAEAGRCVSRWDMRVWAAKQTSYSNKCISGRDMSHIDSKVLYMYTKNEQISNTVWIMKCFFLAVRERINKKEKPKRILCWYVRTRSVVLNRQEYRQAQLWGEEFGVEVKMPAGLLAFTYHSAWVWSPPLLLIPASSLWEPGEAAGNGPKTGVSSTHMGDPDRDPSSWLRPGPGEQWKNTSGAPLYPLHEPSHCACTHRPAHMHSVTALSAEPASAANHRQAQPTPRSRQAQGTFLGKTSGVLGGAVDFRAGTGNTQDKERTSCVRKEMLKNSSGHVTTRGTITKEIRMVKAVKSSVGRQL